MSAASEAHLSAVTESAHNKSKPRLPHTSPVLPLQNPAVFQLQLCDTAKTLCEIQTHMTHYSLTCLLIKVHKTQSGALSAHDKHTAATNWP